MRYVIILISACAVACGVRKTDLNKDSIALSKKLEEQTSAQSQAESQTAQSLTGVQKTQTDNQALGLETIDSAIEIFRPDGTLSARKSTQRRRFISSKTQTIAKKQTQKTIVDRVENQTKNNAQKTLITDSLKKAFHKKTEADKTVSTNLKGWSVIIIALITGLIIYLKKRKL